MAPYKKTTVRYLMRVRRALFWGFYLPVFECLWFLILSEFREPFVGGGFCLFCHPKSLSRPYQILLD